jgi:outer membrane immunogenic protein
MKKLFVGSLALLALGSIPAGAADMRVAPRAVPVPVATWTGCYIGGDFGAEWGRDQGYTETSASTSTRVKVSPGAAVTGAYDMSGAIGGFHGGCNYQFGYWVVGAEGDWSAVNKSGQASEFPIGFPSWIENTQVRWLATARGRLGYAWDKWMLYATGGAAWAKIDSAEFNTNAPTTTATIQTDRRSGWTVGAGFEYMLPYNWSIRAEYLYVQFNSYTTFTTPPFGLGALTNQNTGRLNDHIWRMGISYKFW